MGRSQQDAGSQAWKGVYLATMAVAPVEMEAAKFAGITIDSVRRARLADPRSLLKRRLTPLAPRSPCCSS